MGAFWRLLDRRQPAALARPGEGRHPPGDRGRRQRACGTCGPRSRASRCGSCSADMTPEADRRAHRLPLHHRRAHARRGAGDPAPPSGADARPSARRSCARRATRRTRRRRAGSATPTTSCAACAARRVAAGWTHFKIKVGRDLRRRHAPRCAIRARRSAPTRKLMIDANQVLGRRRGDRLGATRWRRSHRWWIEEPTSPDDVLGHAAIARAPVAPIGVATGEHCQNRVMFKQLLQADAHRLLPDRRLPARRRQRGPGGAADGRASSACRSARTPAASACASTCSTCRSSTTSRVSGIAGGPGASSTSTTCTSTSSTRASIARRALPHADGSGQRDRHQG